MKACPSHRRIFVVALALFALPAKAAVLGAPADTQETPAECSDLRTQIQTLDETIAHHPLVVTVRDAYDASDLGRRERAATEAMNTEGCFAQHSGSPSDSCIALMEEIDACASAFENSADFRRVQQIPEVIELNRLSERFEDLCAASMTIYDDECDMACEEEEDSCEEYEDDGLPGVV